MVFGRQASGGVPASNSNQVTTAGHVEVQLFVATNSVSVLRAASPSPTRVSLEVRLSKRTLPLLEATHNEKRDRRELRLLVGRHIHKALFHLRPLVINQRSMRIRNVLHQTSNIDPQ